MAFLEKYNFFHDALLKAIRITSGDRFLGKARDLAITDRFKADLTLHHYNYLENEGRKARRFSLELSGLGNFCLNSPGGKSPARHLALTRIEVSAANARSGLMCLSLWGDRYNDAGKKWVRVKLADFEFSGFSFTLE